jgi:hypothetical protein
LSRHLPSRIKTEVSYLHHCYRLPSSNRPTPNLHCYNKIISTFTTISTIQSHLHFTSSIARAPPVIVIPLHHCLVSIVPLHNDTHGDELANPLSLHEQPIDM